MIIGISGKISSGKDTVGKIIQYLTHNKRCSELCERRTTYKEFIRFYDLGVYTNWQIKKFAFAVKQVCSILTGIPIRDFEKEEVKNRVLGEEWNKYKITYTTFEPRFNFEYCPAETIEHTYIVDTLDKVQELQITYKDLTYEVIKLTVRQLLQKVGTDAIRNQVHENAWINALFAKYKGKNDTIYDSSKDLIFDKELKYPNWIITDVRFPNETKAIKDRGGIIIRVNRDDYTFDNNGKRIIPTKDYVSVNKIEHESETALDQYTFDHVIDNNGTIEELIEKVKEILIKEEII